MSRTIKRGAAPRKPVRRKAVKKQPLFDRLLARVPVSHETLSAIAKWAVLGAVGLAVTGGAIAAGVPQMIGAGVAEAAGQAGLRVEQIEITGLKRMDRMTVYAVALEQNTRAMPLVDLAAVRDRLLQYSWVADAQVSRRLPDTLLVHIVEREPAAVWQDMGQLMLVDAEGHELEAVSAETMPDLPLVIGPGANRQEAAYTALLSAAPQLKPRVAAATWVGNRRWDLTFKSGEVLKLPEEGAPSALTRFAREDARAGLLGRGWKGFDMRDPTKLVARKPGVNEHHAIADPGDGAGAGEARAGAAGVVTPAMTNGEV